MSMTEDDQTQLAAITARVEKATDGPWFCQETGRVIDGEGYLIADEDSGIVECSDAEFIAHARQDIPYLLAALTRLQAERDAAHLRMVNAVNVAEEQQERIATLDAARDEAQRQTAALRAALTQITETSDPMILHCLAVEALAAGTEIP